MRLNLSKLKIKVILIMTLFIMLCASPVLAAEPQIQAKAGLVMDLTTGQILWEKNGYTSLEPASTTKILTALLALDTTPIEKVMRVSPEAAMVGESSANLQAGEELTLENLLTGALVKSANDTCFAIGEGVAGSEGFFVQWMNLKAASIGAFGVQAKNTNGLPNTEHKMSCNDLALIARLALEKPLFAKLVQSKTAVMSGGLYNRTFKNTNKLLTTNSNVIGVKTGTTNRAGPCLVAAMERDGRRVVSVVLNSPDRYGEAEKLLNYGIDNFQNLEFVAKFDTVAYVPIAKSKEGGVKVATASGGITTLKNSDNKNLHFSYVWRELGELPKINPGDSMGTLLLLDDDGNIYSRVDLVAESSISYSPWDEFWGNLKSKINKKE